MKRSIRSSLLVLLGLTLGFSSPVHAQRRMENLGRGVVAIRTSTTAVFVSWRSLALDPAAIGFNVYRSANGGAAVKLNASVLTGGTNFSDTTANLAESNAYFVRPVIGGVEQVASGQFTLTANHATEPVVRVPLRSPGNYNTKFVWVGDLDGDGEYDFVIDRQSLAETPEPQRVEAYKRDGTFLWEVNLGPNSTNLYNIEPGSTAIDVGHNDGVTVQDLDGDGKAEVVLITANGVTFGDGATVTNSNNNIQYVSVINGMTGAERARVQLPNPYLSDGPLAGHMGVGYLNGATPSIVFKATNRVGNGPFNLIASAFQFNGSAVTVQWSWLRDIAASDFHQMRIADVDQNGTDEVCAGGFVLNGNGTLRYSLATSGVIHGDRFHIGKMDPSRPGLQGYGIQQSNPNGLYDYYYDASDGTMLWQRIVGVIDVGRGMAADVDSRYPGFEVWAFQGVYNAPSNTLAQISEPWPNMGIFWDGDTMSELLDSGKVDKFNPETAGLSRQLTEWPYGATGSGRNPLFYADILGDWREEIVMGNPDFSELIIFTTPIATTTRLYTLAQNPAYRNCMTLKGYMQSNQFDYFMGNGMSTPPIPNLRYANSQGTIPAENAVLAGGVTVDTNFAGYTQTGFLNFPTTGGSAEFRNVNGAGGGSQTITFRYANGNASSRTGQLLVNGVAQNITFPSTGGWSTWATLNATVNLNGGYTNFLRIQSNGQDLANIDQVVMP